VRDPCNLCSASQLNKNFSLLPTKYCVRDLFSFSCGFQDILFAIVDCSELLRLLLLFDGIYHNN